MIYYHTPHSDEGEEGKKAQDSIVRPIVQTSVLCVPPSSFSFLCVIFSLRIHNVSINNNYKHEHEEENKKKKKKLTQNLNTYKKNYHPYHHHRSLTNHNLPRHHHLHLLLPPRRQKTLQ
jgi:hypothetical protein